MGIPTGNIIGEWKQPNPILALLRVLLWIVFIAAGGWGMAVTSVASKPTSPLTVIALAVTGIGIIGIIVDFRKVFGGKAVQVRSDGLIFKKRNGGVASAVLYTEIESCLLVPQKSATYGGGYNQSARLVNNYVAEMAREQTMTGVSTDREGNLRLPFAAAIRANDAELFRIDNSFRDKVGCFKAIAHAMSDALLPGVLQTIESGKPVPLANEYGSTDKLTVSRDGLQGSSESLMPWGNVNVVKLGGLSVSILYPDPASGKEKSYASTTAGLDRLILYNVVKKYAPAATFSEK